MLHIEDGKQRLVDCPDGEREEQAALRRIEPAGHLDLFWFFGFDRIVNLKKTTPGIRFVNSFRAPVLFDGVI